VTLARFCACRPAVATGVVVALVALLGLSSEVRARQRRFGTSNRFPQPTESSFDGGFNFCRVAFQSGRRRGSGWGVDYPRADVNLSIRLSELTRTRVSFDGDRQPRHFVLQFTDPSLYRCPFVMMTEPGGLVLDEAEVLPLRQYLQKGGFLWADDFWGNAAWDGFEQEMRRVLPADQYAMRELDASHPIFRTQFPLAGVKQIPSINFWAGTGGDTSENGNDSRVPHARAFVDRDGRILALATHNTDYGDSWEREGDDPDYFYAFSVDGYAFGVNVVLYALTH
jgi:Domain of unknown function (DUF4159)